LGSSKPSQINAFDRKEDRRTRQQELTESQDRIQPPTLKKQNATTEYSHCHKEYIVIAG